MRVVGRYSNTVYHLSYERGLHWCFHFNGKESVSMHWPKISCRSLQIDLPHIFIMRILIFSLPWALFGSNFSIIFSVSLLEKFKVFKCFSVVQWWLIGSSLLLLIKEHCFAKKELKSSAFFWNLLHTHFPGKEVEWEVYFYYWKTFLIMSNKILYFFVYELIYINRG